MASNLFGLMQLKILFLNKRIDNFSEGGWYVGMQTGSHKSCLPCEKWWLNLKVYPFTLSAFWLPYLNLVKSVISEKEHGLHIQTC